jgi:hypothetical protein
VQFGPTLGKLYKATDFAADVVFEVGSAIRMCNGEFSCPDEDAGCPGTKWALCALNAATGADPISQKISFITCWDDQQGENWESKAQTCAPAASLDFATVSACAKGDDGTKLQQVAADAFKKKFPNRPCGGIFGVPNIQINGNEESSTSYNSLLQDLCATGITAAACNGGTVSV